MNELSLVCRIIGNLFYRAPNDSQLAPLYQSIFNGNLMASWPLQQDELFKRWQKCNQVEVEYTLLVAENVISNNVFNNQSAVNKSDWEALVTSSNMPISDTTQIEHYGFIWLLISWLESQRSELDTTLSANEKDDIEQDEAKIAQIEAIELLIHHIFFDYLKPISKSFLGNLEAHTQQDFYRVLAIMSRELIEAIEEELQEETVDIQMNQSE